jgi:ribosome-associated protein|tara:strand:- start:3545 stop:4057 length:513 start_codon:yes stop_codon:yes gene_type:complete
MTDFKLDEHEDEPLSKTAVKQEMKALQKLGEKVADLSDTGLATIPLDGTLREAILLARRLPHREGRRRQMQFVGKLMRSADCEAITAALEKLRNNSRAHTKLLQDAEIWRDKLIAEGDTVLADFTAQYWQADRQHLRQLIRAAQKEQSQQKPPSSARKLFKCIREQMEAK